MYLGNHKLSIEQIIAFDSSLPSVPPTSAYLPLMGRLTINLKLDYLNLPFDKNFDYRYTLWGSQSKISFHNCTSQLKITASLESLSKYFWDMNALCIEVVSVHESGFDVDTMSKKHLGKTEKELLAKDTKIIGYVFVPLRKYFINHVMNSFIGEKFVIVDQSKKRIGQIGADLKIEMLANNGLQYKQYIAHQNQSSDRSHYLTTKQLSKERSDMSLINQATVIRLPSEIQQILKRKKVTISDHKNLINEIGGNRDTQKSLVDNKYLKTNYFSHENIHLGSDHEINNDAEDGQNQEERNANVFMTKSTTESQRRAHSKGKKSNLDDYLTKPQHTALSMIKMKYGSNHPAVELMKLRLDEVKYIDKEAFLVAQNDLISNQTGKFNLKFIIHSISIITGRSSATPKTLSISSITCKTPSKVITKTELNLESLPKHDNEVIQMQSVVVCNNVTLNDRLAIETADSFEEIYIKEFLKQSIVDLRRKDNRKRAYEISYNILYDQTHSNRDNLNRDISVGSLKKKQSDKQQRNRSSSRSQQMGSKQKDGLKKTKQINKIINNYLNASDKKPPVQPKPGKQKPKQIIAERQNGQQAPSELIKSPFHKLLRDSSQNLLDLNKKTNKFSVEELISCSIKYFGMLYQCEDENCLAVINKLLAKGGKDSHANEKERLYYRLQGILIDRSQKMNSNDIIPLQTVVNGVFQQSFYSFYETFTSYKSINFKYTTTLHRIAKLLNAYIEQGKYGEKPYSGLEKVYAILEYVKKYKREHISFGLISFVSLLEIIHQKYSPITENDSQQLNSRLQSQPIEKEPEPEQQLEQQLIAHNGRQIRPKSQGQIPNQQAQVFQLIQALLIIFSRYQGQFIKITQVQGTIAQSIKSHKRQNPTMDINLNLNLLIQLYRQVDLGQSRVELQAYEDWIKSPMFNFINQHVKDMGALDVAVKRDGPQLRQGDVKDKLTLYKLIFQDVLSLSDLKSSLHFTLLDSSHSTSRRLTQPQDRFKTQQQANLNKHSRNQPFPNNKRIDTEEISQNHNKNRLNTEDVNLIDMVNDQKSNFLKRKNSEPYIEKNKEQEMIGIQVTKREQFRPQIKSVRQQGQDLPKDQEQVKELEEGSLIKSRVPQIPQTNLISIKCTIVNPFNSKRKTNKSYAYNAQPVETIKLFYVHRTQPQAQDKGLSVQEYKLEARSQQSQQRIVPNSSKVINGQKKTQEQLQLRLDLVAANIAPKMQIKNTIGKQQYAVQDNQGQISFILQIQIEPIAQQQQAQYIQEQQLKQKHQNQTFQTNTYNRLFIVNVNKLFCLDLIEAGDMLRVIYERDNQVVGIRDVAMCERGSENSQTVKSRVLALDTEFVNVQPSLNKQENHTLKIAKINTHHTQSQQFRPFQFTSYNKPPTKSKHSQPINRSYEHKLQTTIASNKQIPCDLLAQFEFNLDINPRKIDRYGIRKQTKWLFNDKYRLKIQLFDVKYERWDKSSEMSEGNRNVLKNGQNEDIWNKKILKLMAVFNHENQQAIIQNYKFFYQKSQFCQAITSQSFIELISQSMKYRLTQRQIFASLCFISQNSQPLSEQFQIHEQDKLKYLLSLFGLDEGRSVDLSICQKKSSIQNLFTLYEEFETFDLEHTGMLTPFKYQVIKKVIPELTALQTKSFLIAKSHVAQLQHLNQNQSIRDTKVPAQTKKNIDYLRILWAFRNFYNDDFFNLFKHQRPAKPLQNQLEQNFIQQKQQIKTKERKQQKQVDLSWQNEEYEPEYRKGMKKQSPKVPVKQIDSLLKRQFYEQDQGYYQQQAQNHKDHNSLSNKKQQFIGQSVLSALNSQSHQKQQSLNIQNRIKGSRQQNMLSQTRQQWQRLKQTAQKGKIDSDYDDNKEKSQLNVLKEQIDRDELEKKFTAIKHMDFSSDSDDE